MKRDPKLFAEFKNDDNWSIYVRKTQVEARAQGVDEVLNADYKPKTDDDKALFKVKQHYMMSVFSHTLKTTNGVNMLQKYSTDGDAQKLWIELTAIYDESTRGDLTAIQIM